MLAAPVPDNDDERLSALRGSFCAYAPREERFDRITRTAKWLLEVPISLISVIEQDEQGFRSIQGVEIDHMSPQVYPDLARVPTWNYVAVHCTAKAGLIEDASANDALLKQLTGDHEPAYAEQWRAIGPDFADKMLAGIVAFSLEVVSLQCNARSKSTSTGPKRAWT
ncbi:MAG: transcriptional regulator [Polaromonas sp.]|nr:transcriptional regulator [Polaromonas sp.]